jgi:hypothetical protein
MPCPTSIATLPQEIPSIGEIATWDAQHLLAGFCVLLLSTVIFLYRELRISRQQQLKLANIMYRQTALLAEIPAKLQRLTDEHSDWMKETIDWRQSRDTLVGVAVKHLEDIHAHLTRPSPGSPSEGT